ncbi:MAG: hypothetical protein OHK0026_15960 [Rhodocyclaceae bacterium]
MRDLAILLALAALAWVAFARAWLGVVALAVVGFLHPHGYASGFMQGFPAYQAMFAATCAGLARQAWFEGWRPRFVWDWRLALFGLLWVWFAVTTWQGINPWVGWWKLAQVAKVLPPLALVWLLIDRREKLSVLLAAIGLSIALAAVKGGYWALMTGFRDRVYGPPGSQFEGNNEFAVAVVMAIPLLVLWLRETQDAALKWVLRAVILLCYASVLTSWSRGGLLSLGVVTGLLAWHSRGRLAAAGAVAVGAALVAVMFPPEWFGRMATLLAPRSEGSAASRLEIWRIGLEFIAAHPVFGGGFEGWIYASLGTGGLRDWHNAYVEMAAEHGLVGLGLWLALILGSMVVPGRAAVAQGRSVPGVDAGVMVRTSLAGYAAGALFLGIAYWDLAWWLVAAAALSARLASPPVLSEKFTIARATAGNDGPSH